MPFIYFLLLKPDITKLHSCGQPVVIIKAVHSGPNASKGSPDDAGGLQPVVCLAKGARVILSSVDMGCYGNSSYVIVMVKLHPVYQWLLLYY